MKILGLSGRKQAGKGVASNFILGVNLINFGIVRGTCQVLPDGQLLVSDIFGDDQHNGILNQEYHTPETLDWWESHVWPFVKIYSFASPLKHLCMDILGLSYEQCFGDDNQKNTVTSLKWKDMPEYGIPQIERNHERCDDEITYSYEKTGFMTAREVLQYIGTNIFRKMYNNVWVDTTLRQVQIEQPELAIISDVRFPNEVFGIKNAGGKVIRLTRSPFKDEHDSETKLDKENFDWENFDAVIDNSEMTIPQQNEAIYNCLYPWGYIPELEE